MFIAHDPYEGMNVTSMLDRSDMAILANGEWSGSLPDSTSQLLNSTNVGPVSQQSVNPNISIVMPQNPEHIEAPSTWWVPLVAVGLTYVLNNNK